MPVTIFSNLNYWGMSICSFSFYPSIFITNSPISIFAHMRISPSFSWITFGTGDTNFSIFSSISICISSTSRFCSFSNVATISSVWWCITSFGSSSIIPSAWFIIGSHSCKTNNTIFFFNRLSISCNCNCWSTAGVASSYFKATSNRQTITA